ncbi:MAG: hypothetical protein ACRDS9_07620 [Pseudonocardiaceae bacterium]
MTTQLGGIECGLEVNWVFCDDEGEEGMDSTHSSEFTMLEVYQAYTDYDGMAELTRVAPDGGARCVRLHNTSTHDGSEYEIGEEWVQISLFGAVWRGTRRGRREDRSGDS